MKSGRTLPRRVSAGALLAAIPLPAFAAFGTTPSWAIYGFFAFVAVVVIVLLLHEVLDDDSAPDSAPDSTPRKVTTTRAEPARPRYASKHVRDKASALRRIA